MTDLLGILEDDADRAAAMRRALRSTLPDLDALFFDNAPEMIEWLEASLDALSALSLDHDLGPTRNREGRPFDPGIGRDVVDFLETQPPSCPVIIHSSNGPAADGMLYALQLAGWSAERVYPHGDLKWVSGDWVDEIAAVLGTARRSPLLLRPWTEDDAPALREAIDEDVDHLKPWLSWTLEEPASLERTRERLSRWVAQFQAGEGFRWALVSPDEPSRILGGANLNCRFGPDAHDVGYWVRKSAARQGIAAAAVARLAVHAFEGREVERLVSQCDVGNARSAAFARALGFRFVGEAKTEYPDGSPRPVLRFEMRRESYFREHAPALRGRAGRVKLET